MTRNRFVLNDRTTSLVDQDEASGGASLLVGTVPFSCPQSVHDTMPRRAVGDSDDVPDDWQQGRTSSTLRSHHASNLSSPLSSNRCSASGPPRSSLVEPATLPYSSCEAIRLMKPSSTVSESTSCKSNYMADRRIIWVEWNRNGIGVRVIKRPKKSYHVPI